MVTKIKFYKFYSDAGHGWLAVKRQELADLGILDKISGYSYQKGKTVYLEEDCDATLFVKKMEEKDIACGYTEKFCSKDYSLIRSYESFKAYEENTIPDFTQLQSREDVFK